MSGQNRYIRPTRRAQNLYEAQHSTALKVYFGSRVFYINFLISAFNWLYFISVIAVVAFFLSTAQTLIVPTPFL